MTTTTRTRKTTRSMRLFSTNEGRVLRIENGNTLTYYRLIPLESHFGKAYRLQKVVTGNDVYDVQLDGQHFTCECKGFLRWGHCKHVESLTKMQQLGKL